MCGRRETSEREHGPFEGETVRLDPRQAGAALHSARRHACGGFPWWTLWLIWPAFWLVGKASGALGGLLAFLTTPVALQISPLPLILIAAGVVVLLWRRRLT